ncbi:permease-like cell division protein FtsX [Clostridium sp.]|uniref:permease-like cell division protein FtsX n=1 Tax=Clostridium sp. TaxID=1506 RepID=UPI002FC80DEF
MKFDSVKYFIKDALKSITRNKTLSIASIATVAATLFILGVITLTMVNVNKGVAQLGSKVEVKVFLKDEITDEQKDSLKLTLEAIDGVKEVNIETKEQALEKVKEQLKDNAEVLTAGFQEKNPFPGSFTVKVDKPEVVDAIVAGVKDTEGIESIKDARDIIEKISKLTSSVKVVGAISFAVFILVSLFLIGNTIKITVYSRKREIGIMKYVGATDWFIRWPFIIEGVFLGIVGGIISAIVLSFAYGAIVNKMSADVLMGFSLVGVSYVWTVVIWEFILAGIFIGTVGSIVSMRKFLKV